MGNRRLWISVIAGIALVAAGVAGVAWFSRNFEKAEREVVGGFSEEALRNPLLAAERFLGKLGYKVESVANVDLWRKLPPPDHALVIYRFTPPAGAQRRQHLRDWVESGGTLIVEADDSLVLDDDDEITGTLSLLAELGVRVRERPFVFDIGEEITEQTPVDINFTDVDEPVRILMSNRRYLEDRMGNAASAVELNEGYGLLQYDVGKGLVTVVSDIGFLHSKRIGDEDNAYALALMVGAPHQNGVWLVHDIDMPSLWDLAWKYLPYALTSLLALIALALWSLGKRLGPMLPPIDVERRNIGEHLVASANFLWRLDRAQQLLAANQRQLEHDWLNKHYILHGMDNDDRDEWIAARTGLATPDIAKALRAQVTSEREFIEVSGLLRSLRAAL